MDREEALVVGSIEASGKRWIKDTKGRLWKVTGRFYRGLDEVECEGIIGVLNSGTIFPLGMVYEEEEEKGIKERWPIIQGKPKGKGKVFFKCGCCGKEVREGRDLVGHLSMIGYEHVEYYCSDFCKRMGKHRGKIICLK